jgi:hypothetical protein
LVHSRIVTVWDSFSGVGLLTGFAFRFRHHDISR